PCLNLSRSRVNPGQPPAAAAAKARSCSRVCWSSVRNLSLLSLSRCHAGSSLDTSAVGFCSFACTGSVGQASSATTTTAHRVRIDDVMTSPPTQRLRRPPPPPPPLPPRFQLPAFPRL